MPKYKNIKSVAHNIGHSFLSDMNMLRSGKAFVLVPEEIYSLAKAANEAVVEIDLMTGEVRPAAIASPNVLESAEIYSRKLPELLESQSVEPQMVRNALLELRFDFAHPHQSRSYPEVELPNVSCTVSLDDDRGITHQASQRTGAETDAHTRPNRR
jgi:hypothetical protein